MSAAPADDRFRRALAARAPLVGLLVTTPAVEVAELAARAGLDWLLLDLEHGRLDLRDLQPLQVAAGDLPCVVRVPSLEGHWIARALDAGVHGVMVPRVRSAAEAVEAVRQTRFPPVGARGVGLVRATGYGAAIPEAVADAGARTALLLQVEDAAGVADAGAIAATPGVDGLFIGPVDLSAALGVPGEVDAPVVRTAIAAIRAAADAADRPCGTLALGPERARAALAAGHTPVLAAADLRLVADGLAALAAGLGRG